MTDNNGWSGKPGVPRNPERDQFHWLIRKNGQCPEAWRWDPDADGCGTEYSGAWAESEGDGQPEDMAKWYRYLGPALTPAEVDARVKEARREALLEAHQRALLYANTSYQHGHLPVDPHECASQVAMEIARSISAIEPDIRKAGYAISRKARRDALEKAARVAENEPEPVGDPPPELHGRSVKNIATASVQATKRSIAAAFRALEGEGHE